MAGQSVFGGGNGTVEVAAAGALNGDGSQADPLAVNVDGVTVTIVGNALTAPTGGGGTIGGTLGAADNVVPRSDGVGGATLQASALVISDAAAASGLKTVALSGSVSGATTLTPAAAASGTLMLPAATDTLVGKATTDTLTNKTLTAPTFTAPVLGTPASGTLTNCTGLPVGTGISGFGTGVATALAVNVGSAGAPVVLDGALGTPSSGTATNLTGTAAGLTAGTASAVAVGGITGLGTGVATFLATPSSANLAAALTDETGSGAAVFATSPALVTPTLGVASATSLTITSTDETNGITFDAGGGATKQYVYLNGSWEMDFPDTHSYLFWDATSHSLDIFTGNGTPADNVRFQLDPSSQTATLTGKYAHALTFTGSPSGVIVSDESVFFASTTGAASDIFTATGIGTHYGNNGSPGIAAIGTLQNHLSHVTIDGSGSASNEYSGYTAQLITQIGTGYTQSAGPVGRIWTADFSVHGPIAVQPNTLNGLVQFINQYYNGSPADSNAAGIWITTQPGTGGGADAPHLAASTYPVNVGLGITGYSNAGSDVTGFTTGIQIGGTGSPWNESKSLIGTGISISDCSGPDISLSGFFQGTEMTAPSAPAANGFRLYAQDNGAGKTQLMVLFSSGAAQQIAIQP